MQSAMILRTVGMPSTSIEKASAPANSPARQMSAKVGASPWQWVPVAASAARLAS